MLKRLSRPRAYEIFSPLWCLASLTFPQRGKDRVFRKFQFRGVDLDKLLDLSNEQLMELLTARARRRFNRGLKRNKSVPFAPNFS